MQRQGKGVRRAQIYLDPRTLKTLDAAARAQGLSRSAMVAQLVRRSTDVKLEARA